MLAAEVEFEGTPKALQALGHIAWERDSTARVGLRQAGPAQDVATGQHDGAAQGKGAEGALDQPHDFACIFSPEAVAEFWAR